MLISVGGGISTVKGTGLLVPPGVVTVTLRGPSAAVLPICTVTFADVPLMIVSAVTVISGPGSNVRPVVKFVPWTLRVRVTVCGTLEGDTLVNVGAGPGVTVNTTAALVPPGVVTIALRTPNVVSGEMLNRAVATVPPDDPDTETSETRIPLPASIVSGATRF